MARDEAHNTASTPAGQRTAGRTGHLALVGVLALSMIPVVYFGVPGISTLTYKAPNDTGNSTAPESASSTPEVIHLDTPKPLRAIYMTQCVAGTPSFRAELVRLIEDTELNAVIIDVKDFTGMISFPTDHPLLKDSVSDQCGAADMKEFIQHLHERGIYTIARITVFQDPFYAAKRPNLAVQKASDRSTWKDYKGLSFIDVGAREFWDYIVALSKETYALGFDELNFDYIRFPSDGPLKDVYYPFSEEAITADPLLGKADQLERFFRYLNERLKDPSAYPGGRVPVLSADVFGMTTTNTDDLNIGQVLERTLPYFDYVAPMVYPSHYPTGFNGWANPNDYPYEVVHFSMASAVERAVATTTQVKTLDGEPIYREATAFDEALGATTTQRVFTGLYKKRSYGPRVLRPWLQDFDYGGNYDVAEVRAQMQATYDAGLDSWMLWDPSNRYTKNALKPRYRASDGGVDTGAVSTTTRGI